MKCLSDKYRFQLDTSSKKHPCPDCKKKRFTRYLDNDTGQPIDSSVGRCDREQSCGYHFKPAEFFKQSGTNPDADWRTPIVKARRKPKPQKPGRLHFSMVKATLNRYDENQLISWLSTLPGWNPELAEQAALMYYVGTGSKGKTVNQWPIYWQVDNQGKARSGKLIKYDPATGKRIKDDDVYSYDWIHSRMIKAGILPDDESRWKLDQCLFGLHLIRDNEIKPVAIVEGEKTALIASQYIPTFIWLSTGQLNGLNETKLKPLKGRKIVLFPDKGKAYDEWNEKALLFKHISSIHVSDLLERKAPDEHDGYDIADYLIQFDITQFKGSTAYQSESTQPKAHPHGYNPYTDEVFDERGYPAAWDEQFSDTQKEPIQHRQKQKLITDLFDAVPDKTTDYLSRYEPAPF